MAEHALSTGETVELPARYDRGDMTIVAFPARRSRLRALVPKAPLAIAPGVGVLAVAAYRWTDTPIGAYDEVALAVPVAAWPSATTLTSAIWTFPVNSRLALLAGAELYGFPKWMAGIETGDGTLAVADADGAPLLDLRWRAPRLRRGRRLRFRTHLVRGGKPVVADFAVSAERAGLATAPLARAQLTAGEGDRGRTLRAALLSTRPLLVAELRGVSGVLAEP